MKPFIKLLLFSFLLVCLQVSGRTIFLYDDLGNPTDDYLSMAIGNEIRNGDQIYLTPDKAYFIKGRLGNGSTSVIFKISKVASTETFALRLPYISRRFDIERGRWFLNQTISGYQTLLDNGVPIPKMLDSKESTFVIMEEVKPYFDLATFLARPDLYDSDVLDNAEKALVDFAKETACLNDIGDFHLRQLVYNLEENRWVLLDWTDRIKRAKTADSPLLFAHSLFADPVPAIGADGRYEVIKMIRDEPMFRERERTKRELRIYELLKNAVTDERASILNQGMNYFKKRKKELDGLLDIDKLIEAYKARPSKYLGNLDELFRNYFFENHFKYFLNKSTDFKYVLGMKNALNVHTPGDFIDFMNRILPYMENFETFHKFLETEDSYYYTDTDKKKLNQIISTHLDRLLENSPSNQEMKKLADAYQDNTLINNKNKRTIARRYHLDLSGRSSCVQNVLYILGR